MVDTFQPTAKALHLAVVKLRSEGISFVCWVPFIYLGRCQGEELGLIDLVSQMSMFWQASIQGTISYYHLMLVRTRT